MDFKHNILPLKNIIFRTALRIVLNREEAEDIVQDTLIKLWEKRDELENVQNLEAFALTSARNLALDRKEKKSNQTLSLDEEPHHDPDESSTQVPFFPMKAEEGSEADSSLIREETHHFVADIINDLPEKQRTIIQLRDIEGKNYKEISELLSISESDVKVTLFRARNMMREKILKKKSFFL